MFVVVVVFVCVCVCVHTRSDNNLLSFKIASSSGNRIGSASSEREGKLSCPHDSQQNLCLVPAVVVAVLSAASEIYTSESFLLCLFEFPL